MINVYLSSKITVFILFLSASYMLFYLFIYLGFYVAFNTLYRSYHDG